MEDYKDVAIPPDMAAYSTGAVESMDVDDPEDSIGTFLSKHDGVSAEILARLLSGERLTSLDAVDCASTTRLASRIHYIKGCGWPIKKTEKATGCCDGRLAWVAEYYMPGAIITKAKQADAATWCANVKKARLALRANATQAKQEARRVNALRNNHVHAQQMGLFAEVPA